MDRIAAAILLGLFYTVYYGKLFAQKKQGITTNQLNKQKQGKANDIALLMGLATATVFVVEVISILLGTSVMPDWIRVLGAVTALAGDIVFLFAVVTMGNSWRAGVSTEEKTELITGGIYSISRNPAFLGFDLVYIGILLMFFNWWLLFFTFFAIIMLHLQIIFVEEPFLPAAFGEEYLNYRRKVRRYLGKKS